MADQPSIREKMILGVRELVRTNGTANLTVRALAAASGRSTMVIYTKFDGRKSLLSATYQHIAAELLATMDTAAATVPGYVAAYRGFAEAEPRLYSLLFETDLRTLEIDPALRSELFAAVVDRLGPQAQEHWVELHGRICLERLMRADHDAVRSAKGA